MLLGGDVTSGRCYYGEMLLEGDVTRGDVTRGRCY